VLVAERSDRTVTRHPARALAVGVAGLIAACVLARLYFLQSGTQSIGSDGASLELQAWDMLHGNPLLGHWVMSDVSFWPTELGLYTVLLAVHGLSMGVVHVAGAVTYVIVLLLAALTARVGSRGKTGVIAFAVAAAIMISPSLGTATRNLIEEPDHFGSSIPVLLTWLAIAGLRRRYYVPLLVAALLTVGVVSDPLILASGTASVAIGALAAWVRGPRGRYWPSVAVAAVASWPLASLAKALIKAAGGYRMGQIRTSFAGWSAIGHHVRLATQGIASLFGAGFGQGIEGGSGPFWFAVLHLAGLALAVLGVVVALTRPSGWADPVRPGLAIAIAALIVIYVGSEYAVDPLSVREISAVLPFGAVLAGRTLAGPALAATGRLRRRGRAIAAAGCACLLAGYLAALGFNAAQPSVAPANAAIAGWLADHGFSRGLAVGYWLANSVTVDSGGAATVREIDVYGLRVVIPSGWGHNTAWYTTGYASYVVTGEPYRSQAYWILVHWFGSPARMYRVDGFLVLSYDRDLMGSL
jgi:hypothetical protein